MSSFAITGLYGSLLSAAVLLAWQSRVTPWQKCAAWMALSWMATSLSFYALGPKYAPYVTPTLDLIVVVNIGAVAIKHTSGLAWSVVALYLLTAIIPVAAFAGNNQGTVVYYSLENVGFVLRLMAVGGASLVVVWSRQLSPVASWDPVRRAAG